jgi:methyltransferase-like protein/cyclopropane fatty-acyl-phospholipid synthase-like methyltransferase
MKSESLINTQTSFVVPSEKHADLPYSDSIFNQSNPDKMAALATLQGVKATPVERARVLELGCGNGSNLISIASNLPGGQFVGVELTEAKAAEAKARVAEFGLKNVEIKHFADFELPAHVGEFDYIIANGIFSWVSTELQEKILQVCQKHLTEKGIACISYNTYPGWHFRGAVRGMVQYYTNNISEPQDKLQQAGALLGFMCQGVNLMAQQTEGLASDNGMKALDATLQEEVKQIGQTFDVERMSEHLCEFNQPLYFYQFVERAGQHGLKYLAEAEFATMLVGNFPEPIRAAFSAVVNDIVRTEQYMDFLRNRSFRQTLLCRVKLPLDRSLPPGNVTNLLIASPAKPVEDKAAINSAQPMSFQNGGANFTSVEPVVKAALYHLCEIWPKAEPFEQLLRQAFAGVESAPDDVRTQELRERLANDLLLAFGVNMVEFRTKEDSFVTTLSERPRASDLARRQSLESHLVTNQLHETLTLDVFSLHLLRLLDGSRDRQALLLELTKLVTDGILLVHRDGQQITEGSPLTDALTESLDECLEKLSLSAVLVG